jgi:hypothetical protein
VVLQSNEAANEAACSVSKDFPSEPIHHGVEQEHRACRQMASCFPAPFSSKSTDLHAPSPHALIPELLSLCRRQRG